MRCGSQPDVTQSNLSVHSEYINLQGNVNHQYENLDLKLVGIEGSSLVYNIFYIIIIYKYNYNIIIKIVMKLMFVSSTHL